MNSRVFLDFEAEELAKEMSLEAFGELSAEISGYKQYISFLKCGGESGIEDIFGRLEIVDLNE